VGFLSFRVPMDHHLLVVGHGRGRSILSPDRNDVIDDDPGVIPTSEDTIDVFGAYIRDVVE